MAFRPLIQTLVEPPYKTIIHSGSESVNLKKLFVLKRLGN